MGRSAAEVEAAIGKPMGRLQTGVGTQWLYANWKIQFNQAGEVLRVEKDAPVRAVKLDARSLALSEAIEKAERQRAAENYAARVEANEAASAAAEAGGRIRVISDRGQRVDLPALLTDGKVTIVDFFAPWCGPCRQISPVLEKMAKDNSNVTLLKIDIVQWETPVAKQFDLRGIPSVSIFDRSKRQIGTATSDVDEVARLVQQATGR